MGNDLGIGEKKGVGLCVFYGNGFLECIERERVGGGFNYITGGFW